jgi:hypothetical protein
LFCNARVYSPEKTIFKSHALTEVILWTFHVISTDKERYSGIPILSFKSQNDKSQIFFSEKNIYIFMAGYYSINNFLCSSSPESLQSGFNAKLSGRHRRRNVSGPTKRYNQKILE